MILSKFSNKSISEYGNWEIDNLSLDKFNLIVAKNATGKSMTLLEMSKISSFIKNVNFANDAKVYDQWILEFLDNNTKIDYTFSYDANPNKNLKLSENLKINDFTIIDRLNENAQIYSELKKEYLNVTPPDRSLLISSRRDKNEFPISEKIIKWCNGFKYIAFSHQENVSMDIEDVKENIIKLDNEDLIILVADMNRLGYNLEYISVDKSKRIPQVSIKEKKLNHELDLYELSSGMFRTIGLLAFIDFNLEKKNLTTVAIDDLGEGLDYERATKLGKLLLEKIENSNIQLIATSNDSFLMDVIPIKYWNILQREGNTVRALNYQNSKELFDKFKLTGLSNFDLFSSDYLLQKQ
jgi:AAA domain, putative AbiEii toxin, Type IV TA system